MIKTKDQKREERFRKKFGKYTFCECDDIGIMVHGGDEPKKELLKFISKEIAKTREEMGEALKKVLDDDWQRFEDAVEKYGDVDNLITRDAFEDEGEMDGYESGLLSAKRIIDNYLKK